MTDLAKKIYKTLQEVPEGKVTTYGDLARAVGTRGYQAVGQILSRNPYAPKVPCHRVIKSDGRIGGFMGEKEGGKEVSKKIVMLRDEGVESNGGRIDLGKYRYQF